MDSHICEKGARGKPLTKEQKESNRGKSKVRARVEHVLGARAQMGGHPVRTISLQRTKVKIGRVNLSTHHKKTSVLTYFPIFANYSMVQF